MVRFVRAICIYADITCLYIGQTGQIGAHTMQMQACNFLIKMLGQYVNVMLVALRILPQFDLCHTWLVKELDMTKLG